MIILNILASASSPHQKYSSYKIWNDPYYSAAPNSKYDMSDVLSLFQRFVFESPPGEWALKQLRELLIGALKQGPVPQHVAFEMDGNRRYARSRRMETIEGHHRGFEALARVSYLTNELQTKNAS